MFEAGCFAGVWRLALRVSGVSTMLLTTLLFLVTVLGSPAQSAERHSFTGLNQTIPDGNPAGRHDVQIIASAIANIASVRIKLRVAGEFNGDLYGYVRLVNATSTNFCVLLNRPGRTASNLAGYADAGCDVTFATTATNGDIHNYQTVTNLPAGVALTGFWQPDGRTNDPGSVLASDVPATSLYSFTGGNASGVWTLFLADLDSGATNVLLDWEVELAGTASPAITWAAPSNITYGTALDGIQLNASAAIPGTFSYSPAAGTVLHAGLGQALACVFTPDDPLTYHSVTGLVSMDVLPHALTITADDQTKFHGAPVPVFTATCTGFVNGDNASQLATPIAFYSLATPECDAGSYAITPGGARSADYNITFVNGVLTVLRMLETVPDQMAYVLLPVTLTNQVINSNLLSEPVTFGLAAGAPPGAHVNPTNGIFRWTPSRAQARSTNAISVWMTDSSGAPVHATNAFTIIVDDYLEVMLGQAVLRVGQTDSVPVTLVTTTGLTNLQALVNIPADRLVSPTLSDLGPGVASATLQQQTPQLWQMDFIAGPGQALQATQALARLNFEAVPNQSAFVPLGVEVVTNIMPEGFSVWRMLAVDGRAVVIGPESLMEALPQTNGLPNLMLYGMAGVSYDILFSPVLPVTTDWQPVWSGIMPANFAVPVTSLTNTGQALFFRARESVEP
jgi:subtilisin-like proprotein convertase family protein